MSPAIEIGGIGQDATDPSADREEGLGEGVADGGGIDQFGSVPAQQERAVALGCTVQPGGPHRQTDQQQEQQREPPTGEALDPVTDAGSHHSSGDDQAEQLADQRCATSAQPGEEAFGSIEIVRKALSDGLHQGGAGPAHEHRIESQDSAGRQHEQPTHRLPTTARHRHRSQQGAMPRAAS